VPRELEQQIDQVVVADAGRGQLHAPRRVEVADQRALERRPRVARVEPLEQGALLLGQAEALTEELRAALRLARDQVARLLIAQGARPGEVDSRDQPYAWISARPFWMTSWPSWLTMRTA